MKPPEEKISSVYEPDLMNSWLMAGFSAMKGKRSAMEDAHFYDMRFNLYGNSNSNGHDGQHHIDDDDHDSGKGTEASKHGDEDGIAAANNLALLDDTHALFGVYDGHGGPAASEFTANNLHNNIAAVIARWHQYKTERMQYLESTANDDKRTAKIFEVQAKHLLPHLGRQLNVEIIGTDEICDSSDDDEEEETLPPNDALQIRQRTKRASSTRRPPSIKELEPSVEPIDVDRMTDDEMMLLLLREAFLMTNDQIRDQDVPHGSTASVAYFNKQTKKVYTANVGDSRVVLYRDGEPIRLTVDHRPNDIDEQVRIRDCGGFVINSRVNGILAVTRALGDGFLEPAVTADPHVEMIDLDTDKDELMIIACDGLWDLVSDKKAYEHIREEKDARVASVKLRDLAFNVGSTDNISVGVVRFQKQQAEGAGFE